MPDKKKSSPKRSAEKAKTASKKSSSKQSAKMAKAASKRSTAQGLHQKLAAPSPVGAGAPKYISAFYLVQPAYQGADGQTSNIPYLLPPTLLMPGPTSSYGQSVEVDVRNVYGPTALPSGATCVLGAGTDFTLKWAPDPKYAGGLVAQVFIPAYAWNAAATSRTQLRQSFDALCQALESLESNGCLIRGGAQGIAQRVAEALPLYLGETLYYRYGFDTQNGYIDIQPGMRLRVEFADYEYTTPNSPLNGFVTSGAAYYDVCGYLDSSGNQRLAFDAFLGANRPTGIPSSAGVNAGIMDLQGSQSARRYWRLFYPPNLTNSSQGSASLANNVALIGANTLSDMALATQTYLQNQTCAYNGTNSVLCTLFRGRAFVVPEILVYLSGQSVAGQSSTLPPTSCLPLYVPVGTTIRNLVQSRFNWIFTPTLADGKLGLLRPYRQISQFAPPPGPPNYNTVQLNALSFPTYAGQPPGPDVFDLPLVKGDVLFFTNVT